MTETRLITANLIKELKALTLKSNHIYWIVAFAMESGVRLVLPHLKRAATNGSEIKILVGDYLHITHPKALELLYSELPDAEIRLIESRGVSFHPKAYLFRTPENTHVIVGSSNLSQSALTQGIEWNLHVSSAVEEAPFLTAVDEFMKQFLSSNTVSLNNETLRIYKEAYRTSSRDFLPWSNWTESDEIETMFGEPEEQEILYETPAAYTTKQETVTPRPAQLLA